MRTWTILMAALLLLAGCAEPDSDPPQEPQVGDGDTIRDLPEPRDPGKVLMEDAPRYAEGTTWNYRISGSFVGTTSDEIVSASTFKQGYRTFQVRTVEDLEERGDRPSGVFQGERTFDTWKDVNNHAKVYREQDGGRVSTTWDPPCIELRYPIVSGDEYVLTCAGTNTNGPEEGEFQQTVGYFIVGETRITVPAGTFDVIQVRQEVEGTQVSDLYLASDGCGMVKRVSQSQQARLTSELTATTCKL